MFKKQITGLDKNTLLKIQKAIVFQNQINYKDLLKRIEELGRFDGELCWMKWEIFELFSSNPDPYWDDLKSQCKKKNMYEEYTKYLEKYNISNMIGKRYLSCLKDIILNYEFYETEKKKLIEKYLIKDLTNIVYEYL